MDEERFRVLVEEAWKNIPSPHRERIDNVALLIEDEPSEEMRRKEGLREGMTLLGHYHGTPLTERGEGYGVHPTLPDTITLYRLPILDEAVHLHSERPEEDFERLVHEVVEDTIWHEVGHYFGYGESSIRSREDEGTSGFLRN
jgi:predicted Zn-dependent protease with MMP-like domain